MSRRITLCTGLNCTYSLQHNELSGTIPQDSLKNLSRLRALQLEGNERIVGLIDKHSLLCQMTPKYKNQVLPEGESQQLVPARLAFSNSSLLPSRARNLHRRQEDTAQVHRELFARIRNPTKGNPRVCLLYGVLREETEGPDLLRI